MNFVSDMLREVGGLRSNRLPVEIKTGSLSGFAHAMSSNLDRFPKPKADIRSATFMGVEVTEDNKIPANMAVILTGNEIVNMVTFD